MPPRLSSRRGAGRKLTCRRETPPNTHQIVKLLRGRRAPATNDYRDRRPDGGERRPVGGAPGPRGVKSQIPTRQSRPVEYRKKGAPSPRLH
ncbi:hypothetical protein NDU88_006594 [Pleurodeles waltl]|uniref:Uncharacterized protein n=1 Tax=Pleurodeles waltl TaxID=8319 RepID=A0AAV7TXI6_PLEWA|nr:hypothetical protein NDU88_006594 [Pleurodeles waltl]